LPRRFETPILRIVRRFACLLLLCLQARGLPAVEPGATDHALLERLGGSWVLRGTLARKETTHDVTASWILDGLYLQLHERSRELDSNGKPQYEAVVLLGIDPATNEYQVLWLDTTGGGGLTPSGLGRAKRDGDSMAFLFRDPDGTVSFSNKFSYDAAADAWTWELDNVRKDGTRAPFGRVRLTRK
jgi:hypothetical protein